MEKDINATLREFGFGFKKRLGQNFITDGNLLAAIVRDAGVESGDVVLEIGCGAGTLTQALSAAARKVVAFEVDGDLRPVLKRTLGGLGNVEVVFGDFLKADLNALERELGEYKVVANLPYYVTTPLVMKILEEGRLCRSVTVMVQEEVARRFCAQAGSAEYGAVTAAIALRASAKLVRRVGRENFTPRPNVDSAVVRLDITEGRIAVKDPEMYKKTVRAAFLSRRKTLENNLVGAFGLGRDECAGLLMKIGVDRRARGETLSPEKLAELADALTEYTAAQPKNIIDKRRR